MIKNGDLYLEIRRALREAGVSAYALEARELTRFFLGKTREQFMASQGLYMDEPAEKSCREALARRLAGEPLAYILGEWDFYGLTFQVEPAVLIPRADTEVIVDRAVEYLRPLGSAGRLLDLCTGSGCIGVAAARGAPDCRAVLADISPEALAVCKRNAVLNGVSGRTLAIQADAREAPPEYIGRFDVMTCNPPYITETEYPMLDASVRCWEPSLALLGGADGLDFYRSVCSLWKKALRHGARLIFEVGDTQAMQVSGIMDTNGFKIIDILSDAGGHDRGVVGELITDKEI